MEPLFRSKDIKNEKKNREIFRNIYYTYHLFYGIMFVFSAVYNIWWMWYYYSINILLAAYTVLIIIAYIARPYSYAKKRHKNYTSLYNATETDEILYYDDFFIDTDVYSKTETKIEYKNITKVKTTKSYYIFSLKDSKIKIITGKEIDGPADNKDFVEFLNSKLINSKTKIR